MSGAHGQWTFTDPAVCLRKTVIKWLSVTDVKHGSTNTVVIPDNIFDDEAEVPWRSKSCATV